MFHNLGQDRGEIGKENFVNETAFNILVKCQNIPMTNKYLVLILTHPPKIWDWRFLLEPIDIVL